MSLYIFFISPFSGGGGEASEASPRPVPAGVPAAEGELRARGAGLLCRGVLLEETSLHFQ